MLETPVTPILRLTDRPIKSLALATSLAFYSDSIQRILVRSHFRSNEFTQRERFSLPDLRRLPTQCRKRSHAKAYSTVFRGQIKQNRFIRQNRYELP